MTTIPLDVDNVVVYNEFIAELDKEISALTLDVVESVE